MFWRKEVVPEAPVKNDKISNNVLLWIIASLLVVIALMWGYVLGSMSKGWNSSAVSKNYEKVSLTVIGDSRSPLADPSVILDQIKTLPSLSGADIATRDYSDKGVADYLAENNITNLPVIIFSTNNFDTTNDPVQADANGNMAPKINSYLQALPDGQFFLPIGASYDPTVERSERGFLLLDQEELSNLKQNTYVKGETDRDITWFEYSDLECPYCAKHHNSDTTDLVFENFWDSVNKIFMHFPLSFHANAQTAAEITECTAEALWTDAFYNLIDVSFKQENSNKSFMISEAVKLWASEDFITTCLNESRYSDKVTNQMNNGSRLFGVTGTPWNVLVNNKTGEYEVLSWAVPYTYFEDVLNRLK